MRRYRGALWEKRSWGGRGARSSSGPASPSPMDSGDMHHVRGVLSSSSPRGRPCRCFWLFKLQFLPVWCLLTQVGATEPQLLDSPNKRNIEVGIWQQASTNVTWDEFTSDRRTGNRISAVYFQSLRDLYCFIVCLLHTRDFRINLMLHHLIWDLNTDGSCIITYFAKSKLSWKTSSLSCILSRSWCWRWICTVVNHKAAGLARFYSDYLKRLFSLINLSIMKNPPTTVNWRFLIRDIQNVCTPDVPKFLLSYRPSCLYTTISVTL